MKFYTDLKGTIEARPGDLVAIVVSEYGGMLHQQEVSLRPRLSDDGKSIVFDGAASDGGPFMVSLEE